MFPPPSSSSPSGIPSNEFLNNVNPAFLSLGVETTSNLLKKQRDIYMPGVSIFWNSLKIYFMVILSYFLIFYSFFSSNFFFLRLIIIMY